MPLQTINLGDHINAAIDKMNENFELLDSNLSALDSDFLLSLISEAGLEGTIDSSAIFSIIAETGLEARMDSIDGGFSLIAQDFTNLETQLTDDIATAVSTAEQALTTRIDTTDSNVTVLAQDLVDLEAQFIDGIEIDSAVIVQAVGGALSNLETRIDANSDEISVVSQSVTDLSADLALLDSQLSPLIQTNATAISNLVASTSANSDGIEVLSGRFDSFQVSLQQALDSGLEVNPDDVAAAVGGITDDLYSKIYANSDKISVVTADVTTLESKLTLLDSSGALSDVISTAISDLRTDVEAGDSSNLQAISSLETTLENKIDDDIQTALTTVSNTYVTEGEMTTAIQTASTVLSQQIDDDVAIASQTLQNQIDGIDVSVGYTLNLNANGHVAGIEFNNNGATADMTIIADKFGIVNASNNAVKPFTISGDDVLLSNATVTGQLNISSTGNGGSMTMTNDVMSIFDGSNNLRVKFGRLD